MDCNSRQSCKGSIKIISPRPLIANQFATITFYYQVGSEYFNKESILYICMRHFTDWGTPQFNKPDCVNYTAGYNSKNLPMHIEYNRWKEALWHPWQNILEVKVKEGALKTYDWLKIVLGDQSQGSKGIEVQSFCERNHRFRCFLQRKKNDSFSELTDDSLNIPILSKEATKAELIIPSNLSKGKLIKGHILYRDEFGNPARASNTAERLQIFSENSALEDINITDERIGNEEIAFSLNDIEKVGRVWLCKNGGRLKESNPALVHEDTRKDSFNLFWGDIHGHSYQCDGTGTPDENYDFAKNQACLDFASVSSHDLILDEDSFEQIKESSARWNKHGIFTTIPGYEWSAVTEMGGDRNIYFKDENAAIFLPSGTVESILKEPVYKGLVENSTEPPWEWREEKRKNFIPADRLWERLNPETTIIIPHGGGRISNLDYYNPLLESLLEIYSAHRPYEDLLIESLWRGCRMGFIAGSDDHRGNIGESWITARNMSFIQSGGLIGLWAEINSREAVWDALRKRRVYATTGQRTVLKFILNGSWMGSEISLKREQQRNLSIEAYGHRKLRNVEVWRNCQLIAAYHPRKWDFECQWCDEEKLENIKWPGKPYFNQEHTGKLPPSIKISKDRAQAVYYIKVTEVDGASAWSSPIWCDIKPD